MGEELNRDFKGVWIPREVWLDSRLTALDKMILTEIDSLDLGERGCFASNQYLAEFCHCSERKVSESISALIKYKYIYVQSFDGRTRELKSRLAFFARQTSKICEADTQNLRHNNIDNNIDDIKESKKEKNKTKEADKRTYDDILKETISDKELLDRFAEFIKMRKMIKAPLTNKALELSIKKLNKLAPGDIEKQKEILEQSVMNSWKGLFPLKDQSKATTKNFDQRTYTQKDFDNMYANKRVRDAAAYDNLI